MYCNKFCIILAILTVCALDTTTAIKCFTCYTAPNEPPYQQLSNDPSCESAEAMEAKECDNPDHICVTFSLQIKSSTPNVIRKQCASVENVNSCINSTLDKYVSVDPKFALITQDVEVCTCNSDNCVAPKSRTAGNEVTQKPSIDTATTKAPTTHQGNNQMGNTKSAAGSNNEHIFTLIIVLALAYFVLF